MKKFILVLALTLLTATVAPTIQANASYIGSFALSDLGPTTVNTGNVNTATIFNLGFLISNAGGSGIFAPMLPQAFGATSFTYGNPNSLTFSSAVFGTFVSTSITQVSNPAGSRAFDLVGTYTPGSILLGGPTQSALFTLSFTQTPAGIGGTISDSSTFATPAPPTTVPEPSTYALLCLSLGVVGFARKKMKKQC